jgi:hypothetical protein
VKAITVTTPIRTTQGRDGGTISRARHRKIAAVLEAIRRRAAAGIAREKQHEWRFDSRVPDSAVR